MAALHLERPRMPGEGEPSEARQGQLAFLERITELEDDLHEAMNDDTAEHSPQAISTFSVRLQALYNRVSDMDPEDFADADAQKSLTRDLEKLEEEAPTKKARYQALVKNVLSLKERLNELHDKAPASSIDTQTFITAEEMLELFGQELQRHSSEISEKSITDLEGKMQAIRDLFPYITRSK